jgi:hypothetical protein
MAHSFAAGAHSARAMYEDLLDSDVGGDSGGYELAVGLAVGLGVPFLFVAAVLTRRHCTGDRNGAVSPRAQPTPVHVVPRAGSAV